MDQKELARDVTPEMWARLAARLEVELAALRAVAEVESAGSGFLPPPDRRPKVLFEGHVFHRLTAGRYGASHPNLSYPKWDRTQYAGSLAGEWKRLDRAATLDPAAAMQSASWGAFQIMGFNYPLCGFDSVGAFVERQSSGADGQLETFASFIARPGSPLLQPLRRKDWARFARLYNGPGYAQNSYDQKLAAAYARHAGATAARSTRAASGARRLPPGRPEPAPVEQVPLPVTTGGRGQRMRVLNVRPDSVDLRDWEYQPPVSSAPRDVRYPHDVRPILDQGDSPACTGFALAVVIEYLLVRAGRHVEPVSPHMLYSMARRYDEWADNDSDDGDSGIGSTLRGALKGWLRHGAASARLWPAPAMPEPRADACDDWWTDALKRPLGAYYRIDPRSLRDMHVAIDQVGAVLASALIHPGWEELGGEEVLPRPEDPADLPLIRPLAGGPAGGHAFAIVGYTRDGFIVHNSWGPRWGKGGLAVLRYSDWTRNAMDCWVAQLGVVTAEHEAIAAAASLRIDADGRCPVVSSNPVLAAHELAPFIINMENNGRLSRRGRFRTQPSDLDALLRIHLAEACRRWNIGADGVVDVAIYAHGGLSDEDAAAESACRWIPRLYEARVFPVFLMWESGAIKTLGDLIEDRLAPDRALAASALRQLRERWKEWWNQRVEAVARPLGRPLWNEMKQNAERISTNPQSGIRQLFALHAANARGYGLPAIRLHLVGHSAGAIVHSHLGTAAVAAGFDLRSASLIAPAVRVDAFDRTLGRTALKSGTRLLVAHLSDAAERADAAGPYGHSLLCLVSRALEDRSETPLLGLERHLVPARATRPWGARMMAVASPASEITRLPSELVLDGSAGRSTTAATHGSLDDDPALQRLIIEMIRKS